MLLLFLLGCASLYPPSAIAKPFYARTKEGAKGQWGPAEQDAFNARKQELCTPGKAIKHIDPERPLILRTDWSKNGTSAVLGMLGALLLTSLTRNV